ncbi:class I SAM-dependent methyltransferase [Paraburkholderia sp.]|uniref:class I SAM-dependent methyltransferase n=1 Tax=Paraburkholderia sp. TaxID=1926495 RepID=UPI00238864FF|nr:class I SAM-dependent methyltransferase [Paraburkholderia sp.]MDE1184354.1 class I SAM-dependent methyltransferase [Paraburkholderia sp.]
MQTSVVTEASAVSVAVCKICGGNSPLYGVTDFNKNCAEPGGMYLPLTGVPVYYRCCEHCGLIFTNAFDHWQKADFQQHIYNDDYVRVDPDYVESRPTHNATTVLDFIGKGEGLVLLDYGGGDGKLSALLRAHGVDAHSWDPMNAADSAPPPLSCDVVTAFEVLEHTPTPRESVAEALGVLNAQGVMLFSTSTIDHLPARAIDYWYIAPRNGHITIYSSLALDTLFAQFGYRVHHFSNNLHLAVKEPPAWLR